MRFELRMAWRETRPAMKRFVFLIAAIALGVGALTGLKGFSRSLEVSIARSARDLIAADLAARMNVPVQPDELRIMESLVLTGAELTRTTETLSMVSAGDHAPPILSDVRAVEPGTYPFYGSVDLDPSLSLTRALAADGTVVSRDLLVRSGVSVGDRIRIGAAEFRITAVLKSEPDRISFGIDIGPRILISRQGLDRADLIQFGSRATESFLYRLPRDVNLDRSREIIEKGIQRRVRIIDYRDPNPRLSRGLERTTNFLSLVGLLALLIGGLGISTTMYTYLQQKLDSIAVMKCIGGRSTRIIRIYLVQGLLFGIAGSIIGVGLGYIVQLFLPRLLTGLLDLPTRLELAPAAALQGLAIGVLTTLLFLLPPLLVVRKIRPMRLFLREMPETRYSTILQLRQDPLLLVSSLVLILGVGLAAGWLAESVRWGITFLAGLAGSILFLMLASSLFLALLRRLPRISSLVLRQGLKNLNRPGNHVVPALVGLGLGAAFILTVYLIQTSLISQIVRSAPSDFPNVFLLGVTEHDKPELSRFLGQQKGIASQTLIPAVASRLIRIDGHVPARTERNQGRREYTLTWTEAVPPDSRIVTGVWWRPPYESALVSVEQYTANRYGIGVGSIVEFEVSGNTISGRVANIRDSEFPRPGGSNQFIFSPGSLKGLPASYIGAARIAPSKVAEFQKTLFNRFPGITSIDVGEILFRIQDLLDRISTIIRFITLFAIASGLIILASGIVSTRRQRIREMTLFRTLGATRAQLKGILAVELLAIGSVAGMIGGILAAVAAHYLLGELLETEFRFRWLPLLTGTAITAILAAGTGWLASRGVMDHKPLGILREN